MATVMGSSSLASNAIDVDIYARGEAGRGIAAITKTYILSTSGSTIPTSGWQDTIPAIQQGQYLWTKIEQSYTDGADPTITYSVAYQGKDGVTPTIKAANGNNIASVGTPSVTASKSGSTTTFTFDYLKGQKGEKGDTGDDGFSPTATVSKTNGTATITITDKNGTTTAQVKDGTGVGDMTRAEFVPTGETGIVLKAQTATNAEKVNNLTVQTAVPVNAKFTDTTYTAATNGGLSLSGTSFSLANSGATAGSYGPSANVSGANTINVPSITIDAYGRVTGITNYTYTGTTNTDTKVTQTVTATSTADAQYPLLMKNTTNTTTATEGSRFMGAIYINTKDSSLNAPSIKATTITQNGVAVSTNAVLYGSADPTSGQGKIGDIYVQISSE